MNRILRTLTKPELAALYFSLALIVSYAGLSYAVFFWVRDFQYFLEVASIAIVSVVCVLVGSRVPLFDRLFAPDAKRIKISLNAFLAVVWVGFILFVLVAWVTARDIPLISSFLCDAPQTLAIQREGFLKARTGWQSTFVYFHAVFIGALVPYTLALMFVYSTKFRWLCLAFFLAYSISFLEKALFLKAAIPMLYIMAQRPTGRALVSLGVLVGIVAGMFLITIASSSFCAPSAQTLPTNPTVEVGTGQLNPTVEVGTGQPNPTVEVGTGQPNPTVEVGTGQPFAPGYVPTGPVDHLIWRSVAVPLFTAADSLAVFHEKFDGRPLLGATSSFLATLFQMERVPYERLVFEAQWGQNATGTGSSNSVFFTEAFVNFGWPGVVLFSLFVGISLRWFASSRDEAFRALWPLYCLGLYSAGLIGLLLSNGFILAFAIGLFFKIEPKEKPLPAGFVSAQ